MVSCHQVANSLPKGNMTDTVIRVDRELVDELKAESAKHTHNELSYGEAIRWLYGEYKRLVSETSKPAPAQTGKAAKVATPA